MGPPGSGKGTQAARIAHVEGCAGHRDRRHAQANRAGPHASRARGEAPHGPRRAHRRRGHDRDPVRAHRPARRAARIRPGRVSQDGQPGPRARRPHGKSRACRRRRNRRAAGGTDPAPEPAPGVPPLRRDRQSAGRRQRPATAAAPFSRAPTTRTPSRSIGCGSTRGRPNLSSTSIASAPPSASSTGCLRPIASRPTSRGRSTPRSTTFPPEIASRAPFWTIIPALPE